MDIPVPLGEAEADERPPDGHPTAAGDAPEPPAPPGGEPALADLQNEMRQLSRRVDALAGSFDASVRAAVAEEVQRVAGELQHTVAALGRVLVRDLGRLNQILGHHRDAIVAELRQTTGPSPGGVKERAGPGPAVTESELAGAAGQEAPTAEPAEQEPGEEKGQGRPWRRRKA